MSSGCSSEKQVDLCAWRDGSKTDEDEKNAAWERRLAAWERRLEEREVILLERERRLNERESKWEATASFGRESSSLRVSCDFCRNPCSRDGACFDVQGRLIHRHHNCRRCRNEYKATGSKGAGRTNGRGS